MTDPMKPHTYHRFDQELEDIRNQVMTMGGFAEQQLKAVLKALAQGDSALAETVLANDRQLNQMEVDIDKASVLLLARRTPVASDLRLVMSLTKTINDLERIGDETNREGSRLERDQEREQNQQCAGDAVRRCGTRVVVMLVH